MYKSERWVTDKWMNAWMDGPLETRRATSHPLVELALRARIGYQRYSNGLNNHRNNTHLVHVGHLLLALLVIFLALFERLVVE